MNSAMVLKVDTISDKTLNAVIGVTFFIIATTLGAYIRIPVPGTPVPITLQTFFVVLSGAVLGGRLGLFSQAGYIFLGAIGLPVFQGYAFGVAHIFGPTGGYLIGFMAASFIVGKILGRESRNLFKITASFMIGNVVLYTLGILWLMLIYRISFVNAILIGVLPFFTIETAKIFLAAVIYSKISHRSNTIFP
ncbi:MAG: biotin transporter BioY [Candidatus Omnitrophota bacterium]|nr:biotin transporter BioY [Candidatus Omnitrophota bacterium]